MVFVASHSRTLGAHYANSDRLIRNEVLFPCKKLRPYQKLTNLSSLFLHLNFFHQEIGRTQREFGWSSSKLAKHEVSCKMAMI